MAMVDLSRNGQGKPVTLADVAIRQGISLSYIEQLIALLKKGGLVKSTRGPGGGYTLAKQSDAISVSAIIDAVDDITPRFEIDDPMTANARQLTDLLWQSVGDIISAYLETITLADVNNCQLCSKQDVVNVTMD